VLAPGSYTGVASAAGRLSDPSDALLVAAGVGVEARSFEGFESTELTVHVLGPLPPGRYEVTATAADGRAAARQVDMKAGEASELRVRLRD
jgi:hypothetical protein